MSNMFYWLRVQGGTHLHKYSFDPGPWPKEEALQLRDRIRAKFPNLSAGIEPAWEAPFEKMIRVPGHEHHFSAVSKDVRWLFVYRVDADRFYVMTNLRCGMSYRRQEERGFRGAGNPVGADHHYVRVTPEGMAHLEEEVKRLSGGKDTWDSGWSPASPADR